MMSDDRKSKPMIVDKKFRFIVKIPCLCLGLSELEKAHLFRLTAKWKIRI